MVAAPEPAAGAVEAGSGGGAVAGSFCVRESIRVRVIDKRYAGGMLYNKKGVVVDVSSAAAEPAAVMWGAVGAAAVRLAIMLPLCSKLCSDAMRSGPAVACSRCSNAAERASRRCNKSTVTRPRSSTGTVIVALANMYQTVGHSMKIQPDMTPFSYSILLLLHPLARL